jgi:hypothetical protein
VQVLTLVGVGWHKESLPGFGEVIARGREFELVPRLTACALNMSVDAIHQSREVRRAKYELAARLVPERALWLSASPSVESTSCVRRSTAFRRLGHPPTLWQASWTLGTALAQAGKHDEAAAAVAAAANMLLDGLEPWTATTGCGRSRAVRHWDRAGARDQKPAAGSRRAAADVANVRRRASSGEAERPGGGGRFLLATFDA